MAGSRGFQEKVDRTEIAQDTANARYCCMQALAWGWSWRWCVHGWLTGEWTAPMVNRTCQCKVLLLLHELAWGWSWRWCCHSWLGCRCRSWVVGVGVVIGVRLTGGRVNLSGLGPNLLVYIYIKQHL